MQISHLSLFLEAAELKNFTRVAENNFISQPAVSKSIHTLEEELGFRLFIRKKGELQLTPAGQYFFEHLQPLQRDFQNAITEARKIDDKIPKRLTIGYCTAAFNERYGELLTQFRRRYPRTELSLINLAYPIARSLKPEDFDLIFGEDTFLSGIKNRTFYPIRPVEYFGIFSKEIPQKSDTALSISDLNGQTIVSLSFIHVLQGTAIQAHHLKSCPDSKLLYVNSIEQLILSVSMGDGVSMLPSYMYRGMDMLRCIPTKLDFPAYFGFSRQTHDSNPQTDYFISLVKRQLQTSEQ